ncbi:sodium-coupled monocarboxylate transporter 2, partial [Plakobranchus ocellatus]
MIAAGEENPPSPLLSPSSQPVSTRDPPLPMSLTSMHPKRMLNLKKKIDFQRKRIKATVEHKEELITIKFPSANTVSAGLNSISAVILEDYVKVYVKHHIRDDKARLYSQIIALVVSILSLQLVLLVAKIEGIIETVTSISGIILVPVLGVFTLGLLCPQANAKGALTGLLGTFIFMLLFLYGKWHSTLLKPEAPLFCISNCNASALGFDLTKLRIPQPTIDTPQQVDLRLLGPPSGQGAGGRARTRDRRIPADTRADSLATDALFLVDYRPYMITDSRIRVSWGIHAKSTDNRLNSSRLSPCIFPPFSSTISVHEHNPQSSYWREQGLRAIRPKREHSAP